MGGSPALSTVTSDRDYSSCDSHHFGLIARAAGAMLPLTLFEVAVFTLRADCLLLCASRILWKKRVYRKPSIAAIASAPNSDMSVF